MICALGGCSYSYYSNEPEHSRDCCAQVSLDKIADVRHKQLQGEWRGATAGGCHLNSTWGDNPQFYLYLPPPVSAKPQVR